MDTYDPQVPTRAQRHTEDFKARIPGIEDRLREEANSQGRWRAYMGRDDGETYAVSLFPNWGSYRSRDRGTKIIYDFRRGTWWVKGSKNRIWHGGLDAFTQWIINTMRRTKWAPLSRRSRPLSPTGRTSRS